MENTSAHDEIHRECRLQEQLRESTCSATMSGGGESYLSAFALFLHATPLQLGLLACLPPLIGTSVQFLCLKVIDRMQSRKPIILVGAIAQAASWLPILLLPLLMPSQATTVLIMAVALYWAMGDLTLPAWHSLITDLVPGNSRGRYFARRGTRTGLAGFVALCIAGTILHFAETADMPLLGFTVIFGLAGVARLFSALYLVRLPDKGMSVCARSIDIHAFDRPQRDLIFWRFVWFSSALQFAVGMAGPFFVVYLLRDLHYSFLEYGLWLAAPVLAQVLTLRDWGKIADHYGNKKVLVLTGVGVSLLPLPYLISTNWLVHVMCNFVSGLVWPAFVLSMQNYLYDVVPPPIRAKRVAMWNAGNAVGTAVGALIGIAVLTVLPTDVPLFGTMGPVSSLLILFTLSGGLRLVIVLTLLRQCEEARSTSSITGPEFISQLPLIRQAREVWRRRPALAFEDLRGTK